MYEQIGEIMKVVDFQVSDVIKGNYRTNSIKSNIMETAIGFTTFLNLPMPYWLPIFSKQWTWFTMIVESSKLPQDYMTNWGAHSDHYFDYWDSFRRHTDGLSMMMNQKLKKLEWSKFSNQPLSQTIIDSIASKPPTFTQLTSIASAIPVYDESKDPQSKGMYAHFRKHIANSKTKSDLRSIVSWFISNSFSYLGDIGQIAAYMGITYTTAVKLYAFQNVKQNNGPKFSRFTSWKQLVKETKAQIQEDGQNYTKKLRGKISKQDKVYFRNTRLTSNALLHLKSITNDHAASKYMVMFAPEFAFYFYVMEHYQTYPTLQKNYDDCRMRTREIYHMLQQLCKVAGEGMIGALSDYGSQDGKQVSLLMIQQAMLGVKNQNGKLMRNIKTEWQITNKFSKQYQMKYLFTRYTTSSWKEQVFWVNSKNETPLDSFSFKITDQNLLVKDPNSVNFASIFSIWCMRLSLRLTFLAWQTCWFLCRDATAMQSLQSIKIRDKYLQWFKHYRLLGNKPKKIDEKVVSRDDMIRFKEVNYKQFAINNNNNNNNNNNTSNHYLIEKDLQTQNVKNDPFAQTCVLTDNALNILPCVLDEQEIQRVSYSHPMILDPNTTYFLCGKHTNADELGLPLLLPDNENFACMRGIEKLFEEKYHGLFFGMQSKWSDSTAKQIAYEKGRQIASAFSNRLIMAFKVANADPINLDKYTFKAPINNFVSNGQSCVQMFSHVAILEPPVVMLLSNLFNLPKINGIGIDSHLTPLKIMNNINEAIYGLQFWQTCPPAADYIELKTPQPKFKYHENLNGLSPPLSPNPLLFNYVNQQPLSAHNVCNVNGSQSACFNLQDQLSINDNNSNTNYCMSKLPFLNPNESFPLQTQSPNAKENDFIYRRNALSLNGGENFSDLNFEANIQQFNGFDSEINHFQLSQNQLKGVILHQTIHEDQVYGADAGGVGGADAAVAAVAAVTVVNTGKQEIEDQVNPILTQLNHVEPSTTAPQKNCNEQDDGEQTGDESEVTNIINNEEEDVIDANNHHNEQENEEVNQQRYIDIGAAIGNEKEENHDMIAGTEEREKEDIDIAVERGVDNEDEEEENGANDDEIVAANAEEKNDANNANNHHSEHEDIDIAGERGVDNEDEEEENGANDDEIVAVNEEKNEHEDIDMSDNGVDGENAQEEERRNAMDTDIEDNKNGNQHDRIVEQVVNGVDGVNVQEEERRDAIDNGVVADNSNQRKNRKGQKRRPPKPVGYSLKRIEIKALKLGMNKLIGHYEQRSLRNFLDHVQTKTDNEKLTILNTFINDTIQHVP